MGSYRPGNDRKGQHLAHRRIGSSRDGLSLTKPGEHGDEIAVCDTEPHIAPPEIRLRLVYASGAACTMGPKGACGATDAAPSQADVGVRDGGELADQRRGEEDEPGCDLIEVAQYAAAGGRREVTWPPKAESTAVRSGSPSRSSGFMARGNLRGKGVLASACLSRSQLA